MYLLRRKWRINMIPKYIEHKIDRLNKLLDDAYMLKIEIESWAEKKNIDTNSEKWYNIVVNNCSAVSGLFKEEIKKMFEN